MYLNIFNITICCIRTQCFSIRNVANLALSQLS